MSFRNRRLPMKRPLFALLSLLAIAAPSPAADEKPAKKTKTKEKPDVNAMAYAGQYQWADWVEKDFPFFSSRMNARAYWIMILAGDQSVCSLSQSPTQICFPSVGFS